MYRYFLYFSYVGTHYHGWQIQPNANSVQSEIENALSTIHQQKTEVVAAGRTDTGVHAKLMVAHFDSDIDWEQRSFVHRMNLMLPKDIGIEKIIKVSNKAHARFDAISRTYRYLICQPKNPFLQGRAYQYKHQFDLNSMNAATKLLLGERDYSCFSKSRTQTFTNNCNILSASWKEEGELLVFNIAANRFLRNMVRAVVGTLIEVGEGKRSVDNIHELIESKNRSNAGKSVPAEGLYLVDVSYPKKCFDNIT